MYNNIISNTDATDTDLSSTASEYRIKDVFYGTQSLYNILSMTVHFLTTWMP